MDQFPPDNLPPELDELGMRMSEERPVANDRTLARVMTRAQGARRTRRSLMWRSSAPRTPRKTIALAFVALIATGGMATAASANGLLGGLLGGDIPLISGLLGSDATIKGNCSAAGGIAVGAGALSDCSGKKGANCSAVGGIAVGAGVLSDCTGGSGALANCSAAGSILSIGASVLSDCSRASTTPTTTASTDAAAVEYATEDCDGLVNAKADLLGEVAKITALLLPGYQNRLLTLNLKIDALDTDIKACVNLP